MPKMTGGPSIHSDAKKEAVAASNRLYTQMNQYFDKRGKLEGKTDLVSQRKFNELTKRIDECYQKIQANNILYP